MRVEYRLLGEILSRGTSDLIQLAELTWLVRHRQKISMGTNAEMPCALRMIDDLLSHSWMVVGEIEEDPSDGMLFVNPWGCTANVAVERIRVEWLALGKAPSLGDICWFQNTPEGNTIGSIFKISGTDRL